MSFKFFLLPVFLFSIPLLQGCTKKLDVISLKLGGKSFSVEVARTPEQRERGLMYRRKLGENKGMLFVFTSDRKLSFWMKNTRIPLSIAYISHDGVIKEIRDMNPFSENPVDSQYSVRYALEVNQGTFSELGIGPGYRIDLPDDLPGP